MGLSQSKYDQHDHHHHIVVDDDENNLDLILLDLNIDKTDFYSLFPKKIKDLCYFYFFRTYHMSYKEVKKKILSEKSISIKTSLLLSVFIEIFGSKKRVSIFFLTYALLNPLLLSKIIYKIYIKHNLTM